MEHDKDYVDDAGKACDDGTTAITNSDGTTTNISSDHSKCNWDAADLLKKKGSANRNIWTVLGLSLIHI